MEKASVLISFLVILFFGSPFRQKSRYSEIPRAPQETRSNKQLAEQYCTMCHLFPEPKLLDKTTWANGVLPDMGRRLGLKLDGTYNYYGIDATEKAIAKALNIYPDKALISKADWQGIVDYYVRNAPEKMPPQQKKGRMDSDTFPFDAQMMNIGKGILPQVTLLKYDKDNSQLYVGDYLNLYALKNMGQLGNEWKLDSPASDIEFSDNGYATLLTIGKLGPSDQKLGKLYHLDTNSGKPIPKPIIDQLRRPVCLASEDLDQDGDKDIIICNFGNYGGKLSWYEDFDPNKEHVISTLPGARKVAIKDLNHDGLPDLVVLMSQAYEHISIYYNLGKGNFKEKRILEFSPVHGLGYFELHDFNADGFEDLLVTNGDNRDFSPISKPYHGIRIYLNDGEDNFEETYFYPMYDCHKAMARDFDNDGDLDIIAASLYSDYSKEKTSKNAVVYLDNRGSFNFTASSMPDPVHGNWLTMEVGDFNGDGLVDIALGTFIHDLMEMAKISTATGQVSFPQVLLLEHK